MNIREALQITGKAQGVVDTQYAAQDSYGVLYWHTLSGVKYPAVRLEHIFRENWQPYHSPECVCGDKKCPEVRTKSRVGGIKNVIMPIAINCRECTRIYFHATPRNLYNGWECRLFHDKNDRPIVISDFKPCEPCMEVRGEV